MHLATTVTERIARRIPRRTRTRARRAMKTLDTVSDARIMNARSVELGRGWHGTQETRARSGNWPRRGPRTFYCVAICRERCILPFSWIGPSISGRARPTAGSRPDPSERQSRALYDGVAEMYRDYAELRIFFLGRNSDKKYRMIKNIATVPTVRELIIGNPRARCTQNFIASNYVIFRVS